MAPGEQTLPTGYKRPVTAPCTTTGLIKVRYGDNRQAIFNSRCQCMLLLKHLRHTCGCSHLNGELDLLSWRNGELQHLPERSVMYEYANSCLTERETYVLVEVREEADQPNPQYVSLLHNLDRYKPDLALKLHDLSKPGAREIRAKWSTVTKKGRGPTDAPKSASLRSLSSKPTGSKFVDLIASALKNKDLITGKVEECEKKAKRSSQSNRGKLGNTSE